MQNRSEFDKEWLDQINTHAVSADVASLMGVLKI